MLQWLPDGSLLTVLVPADRGPEPVEPAVPTAPIIRRSRDKATPTATQPFLLRPRTTSGCSSYYTTAQLAIVAPGRAPRPIGTPAMYLDYWVSPDGKHILRETLDDPLSYLVGFNELRPAARGDRSRRAAVLGGDPPPAAAGSAVARGRRRAPTTCRATSLAAGRQGPVAALAREPRRRSGGSAEPAKDRLMLLAPPFDVARAQTIVVDRASHQQRALRARMAATRS